MFLNVIVIVIEISELLGRHSKAKRTRAPAYSLGRIKGAFQRVVHGKLRSDCQGVRGDRTAVKVCHSVLPIGDSGLT